MPLGTCKEAYGTGSQKPENICSVTVNSSDISFLLPYCDFIASTAANLLDQPSSAVPFYMQRGGCARLRFINPESMLPVYLTTFREGTGIMRQ